MAPDRLYGWKAEGPVSAANPRYFEEYAKMLDDPLLMRDIVAAGKLQNFRAVSLLLVLKSFPLKSYTNKNGERPRLPIPEESWFA